ncbi:expressed unknown protein [Seminavis robusta]|uniref:Mitochondrial fission process protein 1 n=1 Tax=Seminavis robusta TaxID=568900 RepID=A0A9N8E5G1_9STRA|nr:expressed unknown protein [Seminavis robusta]|eukprot:Sro638_g179600.1 n/a (224) ;mRNA; f:27945-28616
MTQQPPQDNKDQPTPTNPPSRRETETIPEGLAGAFRGLAAATRKVLHPVRKVIAARAPAAKQTVRAVGQNRPLAFASEGAVAGEALLPKLVYYGAWGLSGVAIAADIYTKQDDAPPALKQNTALYWTAFHIPASLVVPAMIIHQVVHAVEAGVQNPKGMAKSWPPRVKTMAPVAAALLSIIPVVPVVDHAAEAIMEPTLGAYLGLSFEHHHPKAKEAEPNKED